MRHKDFYVKKAYFALDIAVRKKYGAKDSRIDICIGCGLKQMFGERLTIIS